MFASHCLKIRTKSGAIKPLVMNQAQRYLHDRLEEQLRRTNKVRALVLKGRQQGVSTYTEARYYWRVIHRKGVRAFILTHEQEATNNLFDMVSRYHENNLEMVKPSTEASNARELIFGRLDSGYKVGTAGNKGVGRSSTIQFFHGSEVAFWPHADEHAKGIMQAIPDQDGTEVVLESTANGLGNYFYQQCMAAQAGETDYQLVFIPWFWQPEYFSAVEVGFKRSEDEEELVRLHGLNDGQLVWRRKKIAELSVGGADGTHSFRQEYPCTVTEAFQVSDSKSLIKAVHVMAARAGDYRDVSAPLVMGVDPARFGKDSTAFVLRRGREIVATEKFQRLDTMEVVGRMLDWVRLHKPNKVFVDVGGLGAGVVDRARELGFDDLVTGIQFGQRAGNAVSYSNKRAEMWGLLNEWLQDAPVNIPDSDELHGDLTAPEYGYDSNGRLKLEDKDALQQRLGRSPDLGDALALTFAFPVARDEVRRGASVGSSAVRAAWA
ncbi:hypothetical protein [Thiothrix winogradskyi]|uniref:Terminase large subunit gp17-like C-terminal domain-containing protein n=1 Tax=Thiothrix winogradskyi TaxID=96472 RepID=A0ABY3T4S0_9GAMM|nr:hypothetical protein [Thiothrix winogradskyi]UJS26262.1 hypothetical protein L2Y54_09545 [Thiothrix winogradskyi]